MPANIVQKSLILEIEISSYPEKKVIIRIEKQFCNVKNFAKSKKDTRYYDMNTPYPGFNQLFTTKINKYGGSNETRASYPWNRVCSFFLQHCSCVSEAMFVFNSVKVEINYGDFIFP